MTKKIRFEIEAKELLSRYGFNLDIEDTFDFFKELEELVTTYLI